MFLLLYHQDSQGSGSSSPQAVIGWGSAFLRLKHTTDKNHVARTQSSKEAFQGPFSSRPPLQTAQENDNEKGSPGWTPAHECDRESGFDFPPIPYIHEKEELSEAIDANAKTKRLTLLKKVELWVLAWSHGTPGQFNMHVHVQ